MLSFLYTTKDTSLRAIFVLFHPFVRMAKQKGFSSLLAVVLAGAAVGMTAGVYLASEHSAVQRRVAAYFSARLNRLGIYISERLMRLLGASGAIGEEEPAETYVEAVEEKMPPEPVEEEPSLSAEDVRAAFEAGARLARQRLAEKWAEVEKNHPSQ